MKRILVAVVLLVPHLIFAQQPKIKNKKYQGLLWEITGKGLNKPSYLFGTMHVSSKLAFHLADSFYVGIRNADVVALETNPESWQEDMSKYDLNENDYDAYRNTLYIPQPEDYLTINALKFYKYDKKIERSLYSSPSTINNLLYRSYGNNASDFEEDTYLDMYIYQCGKRWGKKVAGVERYAESMQLMKEAYKDAEKDRETKDRSYDADDGYSSNKLQEAYRSGNLDWLDSINRYNSFSAAFDEKFLYRRNEIQAASIDSILHSGQSLFVGVGAAHLPGGRGVIEILRKAGYTLRPVKMGARDSQHKNQVERLRVPVQFFQQQAKDGAFKVDIPGKFYEFGDMFSVDQRQYADMANGSYYMVTRFMTNAWMWGHNQQRVNKIVDSLLYENIPGKIISKTVITRNGYPGIDITNKTRRGDIQRYNIFITPFEVMVFKMSGTGDYVSNGDEAKKFFGSIQLKEYKSTLDLGWKTYTPEYGGFSVDFPHEPFKGNDGSQIFDAIDKAGNAEYRIVRTDVHNYHFVEEDSFDLGLMDESFSASDFIDQRIKRRQTTYQGYPALECEYKDKMGGRYFVRFLIQGPHYYSIIAHSQRETSAITNFMNSFRITSFKYGTVREKTDTAMFYSVKTAFFPETNKEKIGVPGFNPRSDDDDDDQNLNDGGLRSKIITNEQTGEKIYVSFYKFSKYAYLEDSTIFTKDIHRTFFNDSTWIVRSNRKYDIKNGMHVRESVLTDTGSSRIIWTKVINQGGVVFSLMTESDTLSKKSEFVSSFFDSFNPTDTITSSNPFVKKSNVYLDDFLSKDSIAHKRALKSMYRMKFDAADLPRLKKAIASLNWKEKKYLDVKKDLIGKLDNITTKNSADYLKELYYAAGDTLELQYVALETLLQQQTQYAFSTFRDIINNEPPILNANDNWSLTDRYLVRPKSNFSYNNKSFLDELSDSLKLTRSILPEMLPLLNLDDYKMPLLHLLGRMVDSNLVKPKDYEAYFSKFFLEAKQEMRKQSISEKQRAIARAEKIKESNIFPIAPDDDINDAGNETLPLYAKLLIPFWDSKPGVQTLINQMLGAGDKSLKYKTFILLMKHGKPFPDTLISYYAGMDEYRYQLYESMTEMGKKAKFPKAYNNHVDLGRSLLMGMNSYSTPMGFNNYDKSDSIVYLDRLPATVKGDKGFVYFFKYKKKKDDLSWKLGHVGLVKEDSASFEIFETEEGSIFQDYYDGGNGNSSDNFIALSKTKLKEEPVLPQLKKELKKILYALRNSSKRFFNNNDEEASDSGDEVVVTSEPTED